jgi:transcriptional regulator with XRE-family HTH domain
MICSIAPANAVRQHILLSKYTKIIRINPGIRTRISSFFNNMESTPGKRLLEWREYKGMTLLEMARATGISKTTLNGAEQSGSSNPSYDTISKLIAGFPDLNPDWLLLGTGPMLRDGRTLTPVVTEEKTPAPRYTSGEATVEEASTLIKLAEAEAENRQLLQRLEDAKGEILWLRGKSTPSSYAAAPEVEPLKMRRWHEVVSQAPPTGGKQLFMDTTGPVSDRLAA